MSLTPLAVLLTAPLAAQTPLFSFHGDSPNDEFGVAVAGAGDVNWDGYDDVIVGAHWDDDQGTDSGSARVFSGIDGSVLTTLYGDAPGDFFGLAVACAGDVNGDLYADVIVGADGSGGNGVDSGMARVFSGKDWSVLYTWYGDNAGDQLGGAVASAGDVDGDGRDDLIVGMRTDDDGGMDSGSARVYSGKTGAVLFTFHGDSAGDHFGTSVGGGVDVNGDGTPDVIVGAPFDDGGGADAGSVRVLSGFNGAVLFTIHGTGAGDRLGSSVDGLGDIDGDGKAEFLAGAPRADSNGADAGLVWALSGATGAVVHEWIGEAAGDQLGASCGRAGDVDGDLKPDVVGGARLNDAAGNNAGAAYVWSGVSGTLLHTLRGQMASAWFGGAVAGAGDVDGDGLDDIVSGARLADVMGPNSGSVEVHAFPGPKNTWYVDASATPPGLGTQAQPYASIQYAIDQPGTVSGDTVEIAAGVYFENVDLAGKTLVLRGNQAAHPVIDGGQTDAGISVWKGEGPSTTLSSLIIRNGLPRTRPTGPTDRAYGAGIYVKESCVTVIDCEIRENTKSIRHVAGMGVYAFGPRITIANCTITHNRAMTSYSYQEDGGAASVGGNRVRILDTLITDNQTSASGGGLVARGKDLLVKNCQISNNYGFYRGGGAVIYGPAVIESCEFTDNAVEYNGGGIFHAGGESVYTDCYIARNISIYWWPGGGVYAEVPGLRLVRCTIAGNLGESGGGTFGPVFAKDSAFIDNIAETFEMYPGSGAGMYGGIAELCLFRNNGYGQHWQSYNGPGGTAALASTLTHCTVVDNGPNSGPDWAVLNCTVNSCAIYGNATDAMGGTSTATYSNIEGGYPGTGNISADPLFYDPARNDYHLTALSPCIDAGDPMSPKDPDGSRADMGAFWFDPAYCPPTYTYCTAKTNSCGGTPAISATGSPIAGSSSGFVINATGARQGKAGILMYSSNGEASLPFQGGTLCIAPQGLKRGPAVFATGGSGGSACDATFSIDWAAFASGAMGGNPPAFLSSPGQRVNVQWWGRDALAVGSYLSEGLEYTVCP